MTDQLMQGHERWLVGGHTRRVGSLPTKTQQENVLNRKKYPVVWAWNLYTWKTAVAGVRKIHVFESGNPVPEILDDCWTEPCPARPAIECIQTLFFATEEVFAKLMEFAAGTSAVF